ncbi:MAG: glycoside hydrolase family 15 protein [Chloracidobacterium sp.]
MKAASLALVVWLLASLMPPIGAMPPAAAPGDAPGRPGVKATWTSGGKLGVGTAVSRRSRVWFTLGDTGLTEVYYPTVDMPNVRSLDFIVVGPGYVGCESRDAVERRTVRTRDDALAFAQTTSDGRRWRIEKRYACDPTRDALLIEVKVIALDGGTYDVFALFDPAVANSGLGDTGEHLEKTLVAFDRDAATNRTIAVALAAQPAFSAVSSGFAGVSDGWTDLMLDGRLDNREQRAANGNVVQIGQLAAPQTTLALAFAERSETAAQVAAAALADGFAAVTDRYEAEWQRFTARLPTVAPEFRAQFAVAAMTLLAHEDKTYPGAGVASLSIPWGEAADADRPTSGGYHLVWSRDLYHVATAWLAIGDKEAAARALDYLFLVQQSADGSFPQNSWLDGRPYWPSVQLDEVAYPLILAWQLGRFDPRTYARHIRPAAEYLLRHGPATPQERWEEEEGYSPATIAAEIAGLVCAADIARRLGRVEDADRYEQTADRWAEGVQQWCYTTTGPWDEGEAERGYYFRINNNRDPNDGFKLDINNGGGLHDERHIVDAGFLELVRLGIVPASDPKIMRSLRIVDRVIRVETPLGPGWYRYNHDGYGERPDGSGWQDKGIGRLWPLLTGERGEYAVALGEDATPYARTMLAFAGPAGMLPEQVWDRTYPADARYRIGQGTGSATPLAWSMAQFVRLVMCLEQRRVVECPQVVFNRYAGARTR